jgi:hypothetical protein
MEAVNTAADHHRTAGDRLCNAQVRRGGNGCFEVISHILVRISATELLFRSLRPLVLSLMPGKQHYLERLKVMRQSLSNELMDIIDEFGPKIYDDFDKVRGFLVTQEPVLTAISI